MLYNVELSSTNSGVLISNILSFLNVVNSVFVFIMYSFFGQDAF